LEAFFILLLQQWYGITVMLISHTFNSQRTAGSDSSKRMMASKNIYLTTEKVYIGYLEKSYSAVIRALYPSESDEVNHDCQIFPWGVAHPFLMSQSIKLNTAFTQTINCPA